MEAVHFHVPQSKPFLAPSHGVRRDRKAMNDDAISEPQQTAEIPREWLEEFEAAARRSLEQRFRYAFIKTYKPVMDDAEFRAFETTADYRRWCEENLPSWLGYGRI